jgi:hypothetical protein
MLMKIETITSLKIPDVFARIAVAAVLAAIGGGCAQSQFGNDHEFKMAVGATKEVVDRLNQMPVGDLGKLAFSKKLQKEWADREDEVFEGTPYLGASIKYHDALNSTSGHRWSPDQGTLLGVGRGRRAFDGYLGLGKAWTPKYSGPTYVYRVQEDWTELRIHIAAAERTIPDE